MMDWFTGSPGHKYMRGIDCMMHDEFWINAVILLSAGIVVGYLLIAYYWFVNQRLSKNTLAKAALNELFFIFVFCSVTGYGLTIIKMWWPAWRLEVLFLLVLNYFTFRYVKRISKLRINFNDIEVSFKDWENDGGRPKE